jgi:hypothetical protein
MDIDGEAGATGVDMHFNFLPRQLHQLHHTPPQRHLSSFAHNVRYSHRTELLANPCSITLWSVDASCSPALAHRLRRRRAHSNPAFQPTASLAGQYLHSIAQIQGAHRPGPVDAPPSHPRTCFHPSRPPNFVCRFTDETF